MSQPAWQCNIDADDIAWLTFDRPGTSANTLSRTALTELAAQLEGVAAARPRGLVIRSGKTSGFIAGADIREFTTLDRQTDAYDFVTLGQRVFAQLEALPFPTVAAIAGFALGGGLELALACRYRVAVGDSRLALGLPEVQLGIHPGFGGTVRSVRLLGARAAMDLMLTGRPARADRALVLGLVDRLVAASELEATARRLILDPPPKRWPSLADRALNLPGVRRLLRASLRRRVAAHAPPAHYPAPYAVIDLWVAHGAHGKAAYDAEARSIAALFAHPTTRNLIRVFLLQDRLKSLAGKGAVPVQRVHVVGAGVMGGDIAAWCALRGLTVTLQDREMKLIEPALSRARALFERRLSAPVDRTAAADRLQPDTTGAGAEQADVVIEAIFEDLEAKRALYAQLESRLPADAVLASNTSSLTLESLSQTLVRPEHFVGLHFFNPVPQMPLVEIVHAAHTSEAALSRALSLIRRIDKLPLPCRSSPGFLVNRVLFPYLHEALYAAGEGIDYGTIDRAAVDFGMPMGPIELSDVVGLDVLLHVGAIVTEALGRAAPPHEARLRELVARRKLGKKTGEGFYVWRDGKALRPPAGTPPEDLADRLILALVNECVACLREGLVADADLIDAGVIFATGFAPFHGGPLAYARSRGVDTVVARLTELERRYGARFRPDSGWDALRGT
jgi:3-hydroxyacyl-CoA dehydrogenase/enoyl-CoA hydratase/3-hydroxybutyryl-CoA epimerase